MRRLAATIVAGAVGGTALRAEPAEAHGLVGRADLPIPDWLFTWGAVAVLLVSFVVLAVAWRRPQLQDPAWRPLPRGISRLATSRAVEVVGGAFGAAVLFVVIYAGLFGIDSTTANIAPTLVYVVFWLGLVPISVLFGDVFRVLNPWRAIGRANGWLFARVSPGPVAAMRYPPALGYWPAVLGLLAFGWLELIAPNGDRPSTVAIATLLYSTLTFFAMALFGTERWCDRGETFSVYFGLFARLSPWERRPEGLGLRRPLSGLAQWADGPGSVALLAAMIGIVSFDGLSAGQPFNDAIAAPLTWLRDSVGIEPSPALQIVFGAGLVLMTLAAGAFYRLGIAGTPTAGGRSHRDLAESFVHTLVPIALAYVGAHYVSLLLFQGQALGFLVSDPLGLGTDLLGTADLAIDYQLIGAEALWYLQVAFVVVGHVVALILAHDRALALFGDARAAMRSQYPLLVVMVGYTVLALWLLAQAREG